MVTRMPNFGDPIRRHCRRFWKQYTSHRTVMNYSYLIRKNKKCSENVNICDEVHDMASIQSQDFAYIIHELETHGLINAQTCQLTTVTYNYISRLIEQEMGEFQDLLDSYAIYISNKADRWNLWVETVTEVFVEKMFAPLIKSGFLKIEIFDLDYNRGRLLRFDCGISLPTMTIFIINTERMKDVKEAIHLLHFADQTQRERHEIIGRMRIDGELEGEALIDAYEFGMQNVGIIGAPTYRSEVARELYQGEVKAPVIGPINLAIFGNYFRKFQNDVDTMRNAYLSLIYNLLPVHDGFNGILDAYVLIDVIEDSLSNIPGRNSE